VSATAVLKRNNPLAGLTYPSNKLVAQFVNRSAARSWRSNWPPRKWLAPAMISNRPRPAAAST